MLLPPSFVSNGGWLSQVFFDIDAGGKDMGRITLELRADVVPKTAGENGDAAPDLLCPRLESLLWIQVSL